MVLPAPLWTLAISCMIEGSQMPSMNRICPGLGVICGRAKRRAMLAGSGVERLLRACLISLVLHLKLPNGFRKLKARLPRHMLQKFLKIN